MIISRTDQMIAVPPRARPLFLIMKLKLAPVAMMVTHLFNSIYKIADQTTVPLFRDRIVKLLNIVLNNVTTSATFDVTIILFVKLSLSLNYF